ncbi:MAG TPA: hypothetical protein VMF30_14180, partial [Pirellulales bacterium]|nr:hypothetical protein [Pirellulales bacterium]
MRSMSPLHSDRPALQESAARLVQTQLTALARRTDRMFAVLMGIQWIAALGLAWWLSPRTW